MFLNLKQIPIVYSVKTAEQYMRSFAKSQRVFDINLESKQRGKTLFSCSLSPHTTKKELSLIEHSYIGDLLTFVITKSTNIY